MDINQILKKAGLSEKQTAVYAASLALGEAGMTDLAKKAALKRPTAYLIIDELMRMGLVSETTKGKRKIYSAVHPRRLQEITRSREKQVEDVLPELVALYNTPKTKPKIQVFEGEEGIKSVYREVLEEIKDINEIFFISNLTAVFKRVPNIFQEFNEILLKLKNTKIRELNYDDEAGRDWAEKIKKSSYKNHEVRLIDQKFSFGTTDNFIFKNKLLIFSLQKDIFVIIIESEEIVKTFKAIFEIAWLQARKT